MDLAELTPAQRANAVMCVGVWGSIARRTLEGTPRNRVRILRLTVSREALDALTSTIGWVDDGTAPCTPGERAALVRLRDVYVAALAGRN